MTTTAFPLSAETITIESSLLSLLSAYSCWCEMLLESYAELMAPVILCLRAILSSSEILSISYMTGSTLAMN